MFKCAQYLGIPITLGLLLFGGCEEIADQNDPPVLSSIGNQQVDEGTKLSFVVIATDPDGDVMEYFATDLPAGASLNEKTGVFDWLPTHNQAGTYTITFSVSDGEFTDEQSISIVVKDVIVASDIVAVGWNLFRAASIEEAQAKFEEAIALDASSADAYNGKGWCLLKKNILTEANQSFALAISNGLPTADAFVGRAAANRDLNNFPSAIQNALTALDKDPNYQFAYDPSIDYHDVRIILAQSYFGMADYANAQQQVDMLNPANGLDPPDSTTWVVAGVSYNTYQEALLMQIEVLESNFGTP